MQIHDMKNCGQKLCSVCGPNVNTEDVEFSRKESNLVYMDKVYSYNKALACPLLTEISGAREWESSLIMKKRPDEREDDCRYDPRCGCCTVCCDNCDDECVLRPDAVFTVTRSYIIVSGVTLSTESISPSKVTIDGMAVDGITHSGNKYEAVTDKLISEISRKRCMELGLPSKNFFLVTGAGPWTLNGTVVLEGTVNTGGRNCCFQARFTTPESGFPVSGEATFAVPKLALPCKVSGVSPKVSFSFTGRSYILNPGIDVIQSGNRMILSLRGTIALQPQINAEVIRKTLFCIDASEGIIPCDGSEAAYELDNEDDCTWPPEPACRCGAGPTPSNDPELCDKGPQCSFDESDSCSTCQQWNGCNGISW